MRSLLLIQSLFGALALVVAGCTSTNQAPAGTDLTLLNVASDVGVEIAELDRKLDDFQQSGDIHNDGVSRGLKKLLSNAGEASRRDDLKATENMMGAFQNRVHAQKGKYITVAAADELIADAQSIIDLASGTAVPTKADLGIAISVSPDPVDPGEGLMNTVTATNFGPDSATDIRMSLLVLGDVNLVSTPSECAADVLPDALYFDCVVSVLDAGASTTLSAVVAAQTGGETLSSEATIVDLTGADDPDLTNNIATETTEVRASGLGMLSSGGLHTCGLNSGGDAYCWGLNYGGRLGDGTTTDSSEPVAVSGGLMFDSISAGSSHTCGIATGGSAYCWGTNGYGQLGDGTQTERHEPVPVAGSYTFDAISAGGDFTCGVTTAGQAYCWGRNPQGQLGTATPPYLSTEPLAVSGGLLFESLETGTSFACGIATDGSAYCWGLSSSGQLGNGSTINRFEPTLVSLPAGVTVTSISAGGRHTCLVASDESVYCSGDNSFGQLGNGTTSDSVLPVAVAGGQTFVSVSAGSNHSCGTDSGGSAYCWGLNFYGQLGDVTTNNSDAPVGVTGGRTFEVIDAGARHTCGVTTNAQGYCWGANSFGQIGDGTHSDRYEPTMILPLE